MKAEFFKHTLEFLRPAGTSRGVMNHKESWFIVLKDGARYGIGECGLLRGLSIDDREGYEQKVRWACENIGLGRDALIEALVDWPSIGFGMEMAFMSLSSDDPMILFPSDFTSGQAGIPINGLVWMGNPEYMEQQIAEKISSGFRCLKMKIGALDFDTELRILEDIRTKFSSDELEIRVDANGAFSADVALDKLNQLTGFQIHSIEQPIGKNQHDSMSELIKLSPIRIALDEELIGIHDSAQMRELLEKIRPHFIILKPSLLGGFAATQKWIDVAGKFGIGWWVTSALESSVGLNAIAQWTFSIGVSMPQGLGTGSLYTNNFESPLEVRGGKLWYGENSWAGLPV